MLNGSSKWSDAGVKTRAETGLRIARILGREAPNPNRDVVPAAAWRDVVESARADADHHHPSDAGRPRDGLLWLSPVPVKPVARGACERIAEVVGSEELARFAAQRCLLGPSSRDRAGR